MNRDSAQFRFNVDGIEHDDGRSRLKLTINDGHSQSSVWFSTKDAVISLRNEALLCLGLLPASKKARDLAVEGPIDARLFKSIPAIQDIYGSWNPSFRRVDITGLKPENSPATSTGERGVASFFTGGLDSFYTLLKHRDEITHIIFIHGIDVGLRDDVLRTQVSEMLHRVGKHFGVQTIELESNLRGYFEDFDLDWGRHAFGPALIATAFLLSPQLRKVYLPSNYTYAELMPWGSHCLLDPKFSTSDLEIVHDGCEATRVQKAAKVAESDIALQSLRVCFYNVHSAYNCGECEKCIRTMINFAAVGALQRLVTFPNQIDMRRVKRLTVLREPERAFIRENLLALKDVPEARDLYRTLQKIHDRPLWRAKLNHEFRRRIRVWRRSIRRRLGLEDRFVHHQLGGNDYTAN